MNRQARHLESWLSELGTARSTGVLRLGGVSASFPWQSSASSATEISRPASGWRRGFRGVAAAAVIGLVLVGVWRLERIFPTGRNTPTKDTTLASLPANNASQIPGSETKVVLDGD